MHDTAALALILSAGVARRSVLSARPGAPVVEDAGRPRAAGRSASAARPVTVRTRVRVAAALRRVADAVAPACHPEIPSQRSHA